MPDENMYLGDGVYASFDGYHIVLKINSIKDPTDTVYLEPTVLIALVRYAKSIGMMKE